MLSVRNDSPEDQDRKTKKYLSGSEDKVRDGAANRRDRDLSDDEKIAEATEGLSARLFDEAGMEAFIISYCESNDMQQTLKALAFAKEKHKGQLRKVGHCGEKVPYIYHPLLVASHAIALGLKDEDILSACLLHDVCEDCGTDPSELPVNERTREAVRLLTKPEGFKSTDEEERAYFGAIEKDPVALLVKLLDRCNNVSCMTAGFSAGHIAEYIIETRRYFYPLIEKARESYPQYADVLFLIRYHMESVVESLRHYMRYSG